MDWVAAYDGDRSVEVPAQLLQAGHRYEFVLELRNFLGFGAVSPPWTFTVAAGAKPEVLITGGTRQTARRPLALTVFAEASVAACPGEKVGKVAGTRVIVSIARATTGTQATARLSALASTSAPLPPALLT